MGSNDSQGPSKGYLTGLMQVSTLNVSLTRILHKKPYVADPQIRMRNRKLFFLFLNQNICCGYSKEPSR